MDHRDHVHLLRGGVPGPGPVWADLGSGTGAFTLALADLLGPQGHIYSVDRDGAALQAQARALRARFPDVRVEWRHQDFMLPLALPPLDGVVMANSLHFQRDRAAVLVHVRDLLRPGGHLVIVEYNTDQGNLWVPYPLSYRTWAGLAADSRFTGTRQLATVPSRFLGEIYSAVSVR